MDMKNREASILLIDLEGTARRSLSVILGKEKYQIKEADSVDSAFNMLAANRIDVVLINSGTNQRSGLEVLKRIKQSCLYSEAIVLAASYDGQFAVQAMRAGAFDYLSGLLSPEQLLLKLKKAVEHRNMKRELIALREEVALTCGFDNIIGISKAMAKLRETTRRIAPTDIPVLITGEPGTGKGLLARVIHHHSSRRHGPFVSVDCSGSDEALLETELFGHSESSIVSDQPTSHASFERADGGSIFLDAVDQMPLSVQMRLVRFLRDFQIRPVGSTVERKVDLRIIAASDKDLSALAAEGKFREDLFLRLSVVNLNIPSLVERAEDIEILIEHFLRKLAGESAKKQFSVSRQAVDKLVRYTWPGNVRELENTLRKAIALARDNHLDGDDIAFTATDLRHETRDRMPIPSAPRRTNSLLGDTQRSVIMKALADNNWNFTQTAHELGIGRTTLWRKVKKYNLKREPVPK